MWEPVHAAALGIALDADRDAVEAAAAGQPPLRWPESWPPDTRLAMLAATFARQTGRVVAFSLAAMRQQFLAARDLSVSDNVLIAAAACELHPRAVLTGVRTRAVEAALDEANRCPREFGIKALPAFLDRGRVLAGPAAVELLESGWEPTESWLVPAPWHRAIPDGRRLRIVWVSGLDPLERVDVDERDAHVVVTLFERHPPAVATADGISYTEPDVAAVHCVELELDEPLDGRRLVDGARGAAVDRHPRGEFRAPLHSTFADVMQTPPDRFRCQPRPSGEPVDWRTEPPSPC